MPDWARDLWWRLKDSLLALDEDWDVWTRWYEARLEGRPSPGGEELDIFRVTLPEDLWKQGPKAVNAAIKAKEEEIAGVAMSDREKWAATQSPLQSFSRPIAGRAPERSADIVLHEVPKVPPLQPAAIEPELIDGRILLPARPAIGNLDQSQHRASFTAVKKSLERILEGVRSESNIDPRFVVFTEAALSEFPTDTPTQEQVFGLGHLAGAFREYSPTVTEEWPKLLGAQFHALNLQFDQCLRQYPAWRAFLRA
jgi:hypothetical protein